VTGPAEAVTAFIDAFNAEDLDALVAVLDPQVEIQGSRGLVIGHDEARDWATRRPSGDLHQQLVLDGVRVDGHPAVALIRRRWLWNETGELADEEELGVLVSFADDGRIARWQPFDDRAEALRAAGLDS
jgi:limonene-1,2-epoxide hydrolase